MTRHHQLHAFTPAGLDPFRRVFTEQPPEDAPAPTAKALAAPVLAAPGQGWNWQLGNTGP